MKALRIDIHGNIAEVRLPDDGAEGFIAAVRELAEAQGLQVLALTSRWDLWLDEDGITTGRPVNSRATALANLYGISWTLRGTVVITGADREAGIAAPLTTEQIGIMRARIVFDPA